MLTPKENYLMTLRGEQPEWVPRYTFMPTPDETKPLANHMFEPPIINGHRRKNGGPDIWGVNYIPTESTANALIPDNSTFILSLDDLPRWREIIKAPSLEGIDWEDMVRKDVEGSGLDRTQTAMALNLHFGYFQTLMSFLGFEDGLLAFYDQPDNVHELLGYISDFYMEVADNVIDLYQPDVLTFMDDTAAWKNPFIAPEMYREFILPHHAKWAKRGRERGLPMTMHNCGKSEGVFEMLHEIGICAWDPAQTCNDLHAVQAKFGNSLVIMGGWDGRGRLLEADVTEEEIRQSVQDTMDAYAPGGGYCWCGGFLGMINDQEIIRKNAILIDEAETYGRNFYR